MAAKKKATSRKVVRASDECGAALARIASRSASAQRAYDRGDSKDVKALEKEITRASRDARHACGCKRKKA